MYTKQTWNTGDIITAQKLNHMEDGIASSGGFLITFTPANDEEAEVIGTIDKTYSEILSAIQSGRIPLMNVIVSNNIAMSLIYNAVVYTGSSNYIRFKNVSTLPVVDGTGLTVHIVEIIVVSDETLEMHEYNGTFTPSK